MINNKLVNSIFCESNYRFNIIAFLCAFGSISFIFNIITILDINKVKKENYKIKIFNEKIKQQNEKILLKLSLLNDTIFNNHKLITNDMYFQRTNIFEIVDKIDKIDKISCLINKNINENVKQKDNKEDDNKPQDNTQYDNKQEKKTDDDFDNELLNECYDILPCNNLNKITNTGKTFFGLF